MNQFGSPWTEERFAQFKELAATQQYSGSQLAALLGGGLTRMAVIGKARREGIALRPHNSKQLKATNGGLPTASRNCRAQLEPELQPKPRQPRLAFKKPVEVAPDLPPDESPFACTIIELESGMCRWPIGEVGTPAFRYCGAPDCKGSFCARHHKIAYWNIPPRQRRPDAAGLLRRIGVSNKEALKRVEAVTPDEVLA